MASIRKQYPMPLEWAREMYEETQRPEWRYAKKHKRDEFDQYFHMKYADFEMACPFLFERVMTDPHIWERPEMQLIVQTADAQLKGRMSKKQADAKVAQTFTQKYVKPVLSKEEPSLGSTQDETTPVKRKSGLSKKQIDAIRAKQGKPPKS